MDYLAATIPRPQGTSAAKNTRSDELAGTVFCISGERNALLMASFCRFCRLRRDGLPGGNISPPPGDKHGPKTRPSSSWGCAAAVFACAFGHAVVLWGSFLGGALPSARSSNSQRRSRASMSRASKSRASKSAGRSCAQANKQQ